MSSCKNKHLSEIAEQLVLSKEISLVKVWKYEIILLYGAKLIVTLRIDILLLVYNLEIFSTLAALTQKCTLASNR